MPSAGWTYHHARLMPLLLDSNMFIRWGREKRPLAVLLNPHLKAGELMTCGVVRAEVLRGIKQGKARDELVELFSVMNEIPTTYQVWEHVALLAWALDRQGQVLPLPDIIIAACALGTGAAVVTHDTHFDKIPRLTVHAELPPL